MRFLKWLIVPILCVLLFLVDAAWIEPNRLILDSETLTLPHWPTALDGLRVAVVSDVHAGAPWINLDKINKVVQMVNDAHPDLVLFPGDYMEGVLGGHKIAPEVTAAILSKIDSPLGLISVLGNHDWWFNGDRVTKALLHNGFIVLENQSYQIKYHNTPFWITGIADLWTRNPDITSALAQVPVGAPVIALAHNPRVIRHMPNWVALTIAGHTHGGQINLPLIGAPILVLRGLSAYRAGYMLDHGRPLFVSTGIGTSILPLRFRVTPRIEILTLKSAL